LVFKEATTNDEIVQLHRLNHQTFAEELRQYPSNETGVLIDRYHAKNRYFIAVEQGCVCGMISVNGDAPFSIEKRLPQGFELTRAFSNPCEVRLLAIAPGFRNSMVLAGLFWQVYAAARREGHSHMLISGVIDRREMYVSLGFRALGPAVASGEASYVPMAMDLNDVTICERSKRFECWWSRRRTKEEVMLLPGPVQIARSVRDAFARAPMSHRENVLIDAYQEVRGRLRDLMGGMQTALLTGSGTLANDIVAACLREHFGDRRGIVLSNGEFGERLIRQAEGAGLNFTLLSSRWGEPWDQQSIERAMERGAGWIWGVHLETSTGHLNDLGWLAERAHGLGIAVAADCVSSLGAVPLEQLQLQFATGVSGKALGAYAGIALIFIEEEILKKIRFDKMPACFNIRAGIYQREPLFTLPSPQVLALEEVLRRYYPDAEAASRRFRHYAELGAWVRGELRARGCSLVTAEEFAAPTICSFPLPERAVERCKTRGFRIAYESQYLRERGWGQIGVMGDLNERMIAKVFDAVCGENLLRDSRMTPAQAFS
jgi:aspartate aminotransferase-like enzyme